MADVLWCLPLKLILWILDGSYAPLPTSKTFDPSSQDPSQRLWQLVCISSIWWWSYSRITQLHILSSFLITLVMGGNLVKSVCFGRRVGITCDDVPRNPSFSSMIEG